MFRRQDCRVLLGVVALAAPVTMVSAANEARTYAVTEWNATCPATTRTYWDDMCDAWRNGMMRKGWAGKTYNESQVRASLFADPAAVAWGVDNSADGVDAAEASLFCGHGGFNSRGWFGYLHTAEEGNCRIYPDQMRLGPASGGKSRFFQTSSCNSIRWEQRHEWLQAATGEVHVVTGFNGLMYIGSMFVNEYGALAEDAYSSQGVGRAWVENMYHNEPWYTGGHDVCPVSLAFGNTDWSAQYTLDESYWSDWPDMQPVVMTSYFVSGCQSNGGQVLP
ncbi:hypothetical protein [Tahibacter amnicola]|uniref:Uncharacterized protein n=1 Tax=Tahibacter amnicola TaxID=2976241 RepID=A0ABY6BJ27_9GAMM|nr:hypothetical protein [Tahibacter amnicola]UXI69388.1 hypothetical protein N4264_06990 [Tahibacter amnicola]